MTVSTATQSYPAWILNGSCKLITGSFSLTCGAFNLSSKILNVGVTTFFPSEEKKTYDTLKKIKHKITQQNIEQNIEDFPDVINLPRNWQYTWFKDKKFLKKIKKANENVTYGKAQKKDEEPIFNVLHTQEVNALKLQDKLLQKKSPLLFDPKKPFLLTEEDKDLLAEDSFNSNLTLKIQKKQCEIADPYNQKIQKLSQKINRLLDTEKTEKSLSIDQKKTILYLQEKTIIKQKEKLNHVLTTSPQNLINNHHINDFNSEMEDNLKSIKNILKGNPTTINPQEIPVNKNLELEMQKEKNTYKHNLNKDLNFPKDEELSLEKKEDLLKIQTRLFELKGLHSQIKLLENRHEVIKKIDELNNRSCFTKVKDYFWG